MFKWLRELFDSRPIIGWRVFLKTSGSEERDMGVFHCGPEEALDQAQMKFMTEFFFTGQGKGAVISNMRAEPVRGKP